jgi:hypothetical protein
MGDMEWNYKQGRGGNAAYRQDIEVPYQLSP